MREPETGIGKVRLPRLSFYWWQWGSGRRMLEFMKQRIDWLDASRGMAFLMVIYSHLPMAHDGVMVFFAPVFLTTFFFVSGYLFKSGQPFPAVLEQRTRTLLIPFVILGIIMILMGQVLSFNEHVDFWDAVRGLLSQNGENQILWFIAALYVYSLVFYWVDRWSGTVKRLLWLSLILFVVDCIVTRWLNVGHLPWHIVDMGYACFYMALGKCYRNYEAQVDRFMSGWKIAVGVVVYFAYIYLTGMYIGHQGSMMVIDAMAITVIGLALVILVSKKYLKGSRFLLFVGANTLFYFAFHGKAYSIILALGQKAVPGYVAGQDFWMDVCVAVLVVFFDALILIVPAKAVNRYAPQILGKNFRLWK